MRFGQRLRWKIAEDAQACACQVPLHENTRLRVIHKMCQLGCPVALRHTERSILAEEPGPATAAVGRSRRARVVIRHFVKDFIGQFHQLAQRLLRGPPSWAVEQCRPGSPGSRAPRHD